MIMRNYLKKTYMGIASLLALMSCSDGNDIHTYTVGAEDNAIALSIGVDNSPLTPTPNLAKTRAGESDNYVALTQGTKMRLRVEGKWGNNSLIKFTDCSADAATDGNKYNTITSYTPMLYWDDFGTADPSNTTGKTEGLAIYGVAVDGMTTAPDVNNTNSDNGTIESEQWGNHSSDNSNLLSWSTEDNSNSTVLERDLIVSNNLSKTTADDPGNLTFEEHKAIKSNSSEDNLKQSRLIFKHVLSKVTFNLTPGDGFNEKFNKTPIVTLVSDENDAAYCITEGNINIKKGKAIAGTTDNVKNVVTLKKIADGDNGKIIEAAVIYSGSPIGRESDKDIVAKINADGNIYYVYAKEIREAINNTFSTEEGSTKYLTKASYNYVFNVTVNKTYITLSATVVDWTTINTEEAKPEITIRNTVGANDNTVMNKSYDFYRCIDNDKYYKVEDNVKYWPNHEIHYHFRGIYPQNLTIINEETDNQAIAVENKGWNENTFPCNLMIGMPEIDEDKLCGSDSHEQVDMIEHGICARKEAITLNFRYMMSQVFVNLTTSEGGDKVELNNAKIEILNCYTKGNIGLHSRKVINKSEQKEYSMNAVTSSETDKRQWHDVIVPQDVTNLKFRITVTNSDNTKDVYEASIANILSTTQDESGNNTTEHITSWDSGHKYIYNLKVTKTKVSITATITDWETRSTDETDIWL